MTLPKPYYQDEYATLYCGDCRELIPHIEADVLVTDPPYGMAFKSNYRNKSHERIAGDESDDLLVWACGLRPKHSAYIFCRWDNLASVPRPTSAITWAKNNWSMGDLDHEHARQTELILFYRGPDHEWPESRPTDRIDARRTGNAQHPSEKPVDLLIGVLRWTRGTVCDPFAGSGTTLLAAKQLGRRSIGIEIEEKYCEIAAKRLAQGVLFAPPPKRDRHEQGELIQ